jgi:hypothetical protein
MFQQLLDVSVGELHGDPPFVWADIVLERPFST